MQTFPKVRTSARGSHFRGRRRWALLLLLLLCGLGIVTASLNGESATRGGAAGETAADVQKDPASDGMLPVQQWAFDGDLFESVGSGMSGTVTLPTAPQVSVAMDSDNESEPRRVVTRDQPQPSRQLTPPSPAGGTTPSLENIAAGPSQMDLIELTGGLSATSSNSNNSSPTAFFSSPNPDDPSVVIPTPTAAVTWLTVMAALGATRRRRRA
ncbi:MAG: hypothetical protein ACOC1G_04735 [Phycisphaeraceae bacterium]